MSDPAAAYQPGSNSNSQRKHKAASTRLLSRALNLIAAHPNRAIIGITILVIAVMVGGSFLETRELEQRLTTTVFRTNAVTAYSTASHIKDYLESRAEDLRQLSGELNGNKSLVNRIQDIDSFSRFMNKQHVAAVLLFSPSGIVKYSTAKKFAGMNYSKTHFWNYIENETVGEVTQLKPATSRENILPTFKPYSGGADTTNLIIVGLPIVSETPAGEMKLEGAVALLIDQFGVIPPPIGTLPGVHDTTSKIGIGFFTRSGYPFIHLWSNVPSWNTVSIAKLQGGGRESCRSCHRGGDISTILGGSSELGTGFVRPDSPAPTKGEFLWTSAKVTSSSLALQDSIWYVVVSVDKAPVATSIDSFIRESAALTIAIIILLVLILSLGFYAHRQRVLDQQKTEHLEQVAKVREQYEVLLEKSNDGIYILFKDHFVFANKKFEELVGYRLEELANVDFMQLVAPESKPLLQDRVERMNRGKILEPRYSFTALTKDGRAVPVEISVTHVRHEGEIRTIGIVRDLSELTAQKQLYEDLFNHAPIGLAIYKNFKAVKVNNEAAELLNYDRPDDLIGAHVLQFVHPDDLSMVREMVKKAMEDRVPAAPYEERFIRRDGSSFHALVLSQPVVYESEDAVQVAFVSIEDRKTLEENLEREAALQELEKLRLNTLLQNLNEGILFQGGNGTIEFANAEFCRIVGIAESASIIGKKSDEVLADAARMTDYPEEFVSRVSRDVEQRRVVEDERHEFKNGVIVERSALPLYDSADNYIGRLTIFRDVTTRERNAETIKRLQRTELLGRLAGGIAHDFNNVLAIIIGSLQMILRKIDNQASVRDNTQRALSSAFRGSEISKRLLQFVRYSPRGFEVFSLKQIVEETASILRHTFEENIAIHIEFPIGDANVYGSPGDMQQVLINLANNARDAMPGGGTLTISLTAASRKQIEKRLGNSAANRYVLLKVQDTGEGIDADKIDKIYDPFFTTRDIGKGTGLGLSIVQTIISAHAGFVEVESKPGAGTTFYLFLPTTDDRPALEETAPRNEGTRTGEVTGKPTILVVEDETGLRELLYEFLSDKNFNVITAKDGEEGLRFFETNPEISLVLSDLGLPKLAGDEMLARMKTKRPEVKCILATGYLTPNAGGVLDHLNVKMIMKPYNLSAVYTCLVETLASRPSREMP